MLKKLVPNVVLCACSILLLPLCPTAFAQEKAEEPVTGPVPAAFRLESDAWFVQRDTWIYPTTNADLIADLTNRGYEATPEGFKRTRTSGWKWSVRKDGYTPVQEGAPIQAKVTTTAQRFRVRTKDNWELLVRQDGSLVKQETKITPVTRTQRVPTGRRVQTGWAPFPGTLVPAPIYEDEYENRVVTVNQTTVVNTPKDSEVPGEPVPLPQEINVGSTSSFVFLGDPNFKATWTVTRIYKRGGFTYAEGDLKSADETVATLSGTMVLRLDVGAVERLNAKIVYPKGKFLDKPVDTYTNQTEVTRVSKAEYEAVQTAEWRRYANMGTTSPIWQQNIAEGRLADSIWTIKGADWKVRFLPENRFSAFRDAKEVIGTWKIVNRFIQLTFAESKAEAKFAFSLATSTLEATGDNVAQPSKFFDDAAQ